MTANHVSIGESSRPASSARPSQDVHCALSKLVWPHVGQMKSSIRFSRIVDGTQAGFGVGPFLPRDRADQTHPTATAATLVASRWISWAASAIFTKLGGTAFHHSEPVQAASRGNRWPKSMGIVSVQHPRWEQRMLSEVFVARPRSGKCGHGVGTGQSADQPIGS
jgi:hypothetical protein